MHSEWRSLRVCACLVYVGDIGVGVDVLVLRTAALTHNISDLETAGGDNVSSGWVVTCWIYKEGSLDRMSSLLLQHSHIHLCSKHIKDNCSSQSINRSINQSISLNLRVSYRRHNTQSTTFPSHPHIPHTPSANHPPTSPSPCPPGSPTSATTPPATLATLTLSLLPRRRRRQHKNPARSPTGVT